MAVLAASPGLLLAQATRPTTRPMSAVPAELTGKLIQQVVIVGKDKELGSAAISEISRTIRTAEGERFDPATVEDDYKKINDLKKFSNVEARVVPNETGGVNVVFVVTEQSLIKEIRFRGNEDVQTKTLQEAVNLKVGEAIDPFRLSLAEDAIKRIYRSKNYPNAHVVIDQEELNKNGVVVFTVVEGPKVRVRKVRILGNRSFTNARIKDQVKTKSWFPIFSGGTFDEDQVAADVTSIRRFYEDHGFFDVWVDSRKIVSANQKEVMVDFLIEEGKRYRVEKVVFEISPGTGPGSGITEADLRKNMRMTEGQYYNEDVVKRDIREIVRVYGPKGYIYTPQDPQPDPDYMKIEHVKDVFREPGKVVLRYRITEGKRFVLGPVIVKGNARIKDKVIIRELRDLQPGRLYNSYATQRARDRIMATNLFRSVTLTPIAPPEGIPEEPVGGEPGVRALLVEVQETQTARFMLGAGVTSNLGLLGNITYEQRNFDITNWPTSWSEFFSNRAFTGAGQTFRVQLEPGTQLSRARIDFIEPWIFDQPYSLGLSAYLSQHNRPDWMETRIGGRVSLGHRFSDIWSARVALRGEDVEVGSIRDREFRAPEVLDLEGHSALTSVGLEVRRNTTDSPILPSKGTITSVAWEHYGALGGDFDFDKFTGSFDWFGTLYEDLLERKTIVSVRSDVGYITGSDAPFFEKFYGGGIGSVRGFRYRGISPRSGIEDDPVGGEFSLTGTVELSFPLVSDALRGVVFADAGTVERDVEFGTIRTSVGFGVRLTLPFLGQIPIALDLGFPITKSDKDQTQLFSFSLGLMQ